MKKVLALVSMAAVVALLVAGLAGAFGSSDTPSVYASRLAGISGAGATGIQVQNLDASEAAQIQAVFYPQKGGAATTIAKPNVGAGNAALIYLPQEGSLENGAYAAIISADRQIAAIARTEWESSGGAALYSNVIPSENVALALALKGYSNSYSLVSVQNTDVSNVANVDVKFYRTGESTPAVDYTISIDPGTSKTIDLKNDVNFVGTVPDGTVGSMTFESSIPVAVQSFVDITNQTKAVYAFEGVPAESASDTLYAPLFRNDFYGTTGISVVNPGSTDIQVTLTYYGDPNLGSCHNTVVHNGGPVAIPAGSSKVFYQGGPFDGTDPMLPKDCVGSAVLSATGGDMLAIVNDQIFGTNGTSAAYNTVSADQGAGKVALPLYRNEHLSSKITTGIQVMNIESGTDISTELEIKDSNGTVISNACASSGDCSATIGPNQSYTYYPPTMSGLDKGIYGSATLTVTGGNAAVIVNDASGTQKFDAAIYNGIKADG